MALLKGMLGDNTITMMDWLFDFEAMFETIHLVTYYEGRVIVFFAEILFHEILPHQFKQDLFPLWIQEVFPDPIRQAVANLMSNLDHTKKNCCSQII